jgi:hypothetical protein
MLLALYAVSLKELYTLVAPIGLVNEDSANELAVLGPNGLESPEEYVPRELCGLKGSPVDPPPVSLVALVVSQANSPLAHITELFLAVITSVLKSLIMLAFVINDPCGYAIIRLLRIR